MKIETLELCTGIRSPAALLGDSAIRQEQLQTSAAESFMYSSSVIKNTRSDVKTKEKRAILHFYRSPQHNFFRPRCFRVMCLTSPLVTNHFRMAGLS